MRNASLPSLLVASLLLAVALAGCAGGKSNEEPSASSAPATPKVTEDTGSVSGVVTNDELVGIAGADLVLQGTEISGVTDSDGRYALNAVPPGTYTIYTAAIGYGSAGALVTVAAGRVTEKHFLLSAIAVAEPRYESIPFSGRFECSLALVDVFWLDCSEEAAFPESTSRHYFTKEAEAGVTHVVGELRWQATSASTGRNLDFNLVGGADHEDCQWYANVFGPSPLRIAYQVGERFENPDSPAAVGGCGDEVLDDEDEEFGFDIYSSPVYADELGAPERAALAGVTFQQPYEGMVTLFYDMEPGTEFSAFPDA